jgi:hypothetical protein
MAPKKHIPPERLAEARRLYEQTLAPVDNIAAMLGISKAPFYRIRREQCWRQRRASAATFEFVRALSADSVAAITGEPRAESTPAEPATAAQRATLAQRIQRVVEREIDAVERVLNVITPADQGEADRSARTLANISRTLREIAALNEPEKVTPPDANDDPIPDDIDEYRDALARRIRGFFEARRARTG